MITYRDIESLSEDHPLRVQLFRELIAEEECAAEEVILNYDDEESQAYFDRYVAGDR